MSAGAKNRRSIMYVQYLEHIKFDSFDELEKNVFKVVGDKYQVASIIHDKDVSDETGELERPHIHMFFYCENKLSIAKLMQATNETQMNQFEFFERKDAGFLYLIHAGRKDRHKYQYSIDEVSANFDYQEYVENLKVNYSTSLDTMLEDVLESRIKYSDIQNNNDLSLLYAKNKTKIDNALNIASKRRVEARKNMEIPVVWIYGDYSGVGKTAYAKQKAEELKMAYGYSSYMTSANNDPFQEYKGEEVVIIDDIKPDDIELSDLLRLLDPYNATSVRSRYSNKYVSADVIFVTSMYSPEQFFIESSINFDKEPIDQLLRRISSVCYVKPVNDGEYLAEVSVFKMNKLDEPVVIEGKFDYIAGKKVEVKTHYQLRETKKKN